MRQRSERFNNSKSIQDSPCVLKSVRFFPENNAELVIYDSSIGAEPLQAKVRLDKRLPSVDFGENGLPMSYGIYAQLIGSGEFYITWG